MDCKVLGFCPATAESKVVLPKLRLAKTPLFSKLQVSVRVLQSVDAVWICSAWLTPLQERFVCPEYAVYAV